MREIQLLDCTLRDGGYINDWEFGSSNLVSIFQRVADAGIDIIELGFLDERRPVDLNRSIFPDTKTIKSIWGNLSNANIVKVAMIDYGTCSLDKLEACENSILDGIRVIFKKGKMHEAMEYCAQVKALGYKVFCQLVSITSYEEEDIDEIIRLTNEVEPYALSMVDTYGLLNPTSMEHYYERLDAGLKDTIRIGFHAHNNLQLAYANSVAFLQKETSRSILIDGTLFGMGKSAGNAPLELLSFFVNELKINKGYVVNSLLEAIEESIKPIFGETLWGYKVFFYLSACNNCHPSYVENLKNRGNLSISKINTALGKIEPEESKLLYSSDVAEATYQKAMQEIDDEKNLKILGSIIQGRNILILGPGKNLYLQKERIESYIEEKHPFVIAINFIPPIYHVDAVFISKVNRYLEMSEKLVGKSVVQIATSNLECRGGDFDCQFDRKVLIDETKEISDNPFLMFLRILKKMNVDHIACAGMDGYSDKEDNYAITNMEYAFIKNAARYLNQMIRDELNAEFSDMDIKFITYTHYRGKLASEEYDD